MDITYLGHSSFRIKTKDVSFVTDPFDPAMVGIKFPKVEADFVTISHDHKDHNFIEGVKSFRKMISGPGEYEIGGVSIRGLKTFHDAEGGTNRGINTVYVFESEDLKVVHLGDLGGKLTEGDLEIIGDVNILMIPVGGVYTIDASEASQVVRDIEPNLILPMHYASKDLNPGSFGGLAAVEEFIKEVGIGEVKMEKLAIKASDLDQDQKIILLARKV